MSVEIQSQFCLTCYAQTIGRCANRLLRLTGICSDNRCFRDIVEKCIGFGGLEGAEVKKVCNKLIEPGIVWSNQVDHSSLISHLFVEQLVINNDGNSDCQFETVCSEVKHILARKLLVMFDIWLKPSHFEYIHCSGKGPLLPTDFDVITPNDKLAGHSVVLYMWENDVLYFKNSWGGKSGFRGEFRLHQSMLTFPGSRCKFTAINIHEDRLSEEMRSHMQAFQPDVNWLPFLPFLKESSVGLNKKVPATSRPLLIELDCDGLGKGSSGIVKRSVHYEEADPRRVFHPQRAELEVAVKVALCYNEELEKTLNRLYVYDHPSIVRYLGMWSTYNSEERSQKSHIYAVMDLELTTLAALMRSATANTTAISSPAAGGPLGWGRFFEVVLDVGRGVQYLHQHGMTHYDICAENIMLGRDGRWKLTDLWNIVTIGTVTGKGTGHKDWVEAAAIITRHGLEVDLYSLGKLMLYLLLGPEGVKAEATSAANVRSDVWALFQQCVAPKESRIKIDQFLERFQALGQFRSRQLRPYYGALIVRGTDDVALCGFYVPSLEECHGGFICYSRYGSSGSSSATLRFNPVSSVWELVVNDAVVAVWEGVDGEAQVRDPVRSVCGRFQLESEVTPYIDVSGVCGELASDLNGIYFRVEKDTSSGYYSFRRLHNDTIRLLYAADESVWRIVRDEQVLATCAAPAGKYLHEVVDHEWRILSPTGSVEVQASVRVYGRSSAAKICDFSLLINSSGTGGGPSAEQLYSQGVALLHGDGVTRNTTAAVGLLHLAAESGLSSAQFSLGDVYRDGLGVKTDAKQALVWYRKAADQGMREAQNAVGELYKAEKKHSEALQWFQKAADKGLRQAQFNLGNAHRFGDGVARNPAEALKCYRLAANQRLVEAQYAMGELHRTGSGVAKDAGEAMRWYRSAAEGGFHAAQKCLGDGYRSGEGVAKDLPLAVHWYLKAAEQKNNAAQAALGDIYQAGGDGVLKNAYQAVTWYEKAVENGNTMVKQKLEAAKAEM